MGVVYVVTNKVNGKQYVGKTCQTFEARRHAHEWLASKPQSGHESLLQAAIRKYGAEQFEWQVVFESDDEKLLLQREREVSIELGTLAPRGYNKVLGGGGLSKPPVFVTCAACGKEFRVMPSKFKYNVERGYRFACSKQCTRKIISQSTSGVNNPRYKDGVRMRQVQAQRERKGKKHDS